MGIPDHYSRALPERCMTLVEHLYPCARQVFPPEGNMFGPLTSTFLLSMSIPIVTLPIERIERNGGGYTDDRPLDEPLSNEIKRVLGGQPIRRAPFFESDAWRYLKVDGNTLAVQDIARGLPPEYTVPLAEEPAKLAAARMPGSQWTALMRNALAHGGIAYLDREGHTRDNVGASYYAFVSGKYDKEDTFHQKPPVELHILRISEPDYLGFLRRWVAWLSTVRVPQATMDFEAA